VSAEDPDRAAAFYKEALGWDVQKWDGPQEYWVLTTGAEDAPGINGGMNRRTAESLSGATNISGVASVDDSIARVIAARCGVLGREAHAHLG
jgi:predicted enzyme related to lactoylglutathione lyase